MDMLSLEAEGKALNEISEKYAKTADERRDIEERLHDWKKRLLDAEAAAYTSAYSKQEKAFSDAQEENGTAMSMKLIVSGRMGLQAAPVSDRHIAIRSIAVTGFLCIWKS